MKTPSICPSCEHPFDKHGNDGCGVWLKHRFGSRFCGCMTKNTVSLPFSPDDVRSGRLKPTSNIPLSEAWLDAASWIGNPANGTRYVTLHAAREYGDKVRGEVWEEIGMSENTDDAAIAKIMLFGLKWRDRSRTLCAFLNDKVWPWIGCIPCDKRESATCAEVLEQLRKHIDEGLR